MNCSFVFGEYGQSNVHIVRREDRCLEDGSAFVNTRGELQLSAQVGYKGHKDALQ